MAYTTSRFEAAGLKCIEVVAPGDATERPLVVGLHGLGDRGDSYVNFADVLPPGYRYIFPTGPQPVRYGAAVVGYAWFDIFRRDFGASVAAARPTITNLFSALRQKYGIPPNRTGYAWLLARGDGYA